MTSQPIWLVEQRRGLARLVKRPPALRSGVGAKDRQILIEAQRRRTGRCGKGEAGGQVRKRGAGRHRWMMPQRVWFGDSEIEAGRAL